MTSDGQLVDAPDQARDSPGGAAARADKSALAGVPHTATGLIDLGASRLAVLDNSGDEWSAEPSSVSDVEDYDTLKLDPAAVVKGSKGGGVENGPILAPKRMADSMSEESSNSSEEPASYKTNQPLPRKPTSPSFARRKSIQVVLEKTDEKGRYIIRADDPEIRDIIRHGIERETAASGSGKAYRTRFRDLVFTRQFTAFDRRNALGSESPFRGFFTLFWLGMGLLLVKVAAQNWRAHGSVFGGKELMHMMFDRDLIVLGLTDGVMCASTAFGLLLQRVVLNGWLSWNRSGWIIQNVWQTFYLAAVIGWTLYREWPWTHTIFIVLHGLVFVMKQHSYNFYNGYCKSTIMPAQLISCSYNTAVSQVYRRRALLEQKLAQLDEIEPIASPSTCHDPHNQIPTTPTDSQPSNGMRQRCRSFGPKVSTNLQTEQSQISPIASAIESGRPLDVNELQAFSEVIRSEIASLTSELNGKCTCGSNRYPRNLTLSNWADWICLPTLVYELEYPRQESRNWWYVAEKTAATFGVIWVMMVISQAYIYPAVLETVRMKDAGMTLAQRWHEFPWVVSDMLFPLLLEQLLSWYVIWECCLNVLAELTRFADRGFYGDWWNSVSWDQYARDWNRPVHNFLLRHVYHSSISAFHLSKSSATFVTFLLSACVHELIMLCLFKKVRGYLFMMQLLQLPLVSLSRTKLLRGRNVLGNLFFWFGLFVGPSLLTSLYLIV